MRERLARGGAVLSTCVDESCSRCEGSVESCTGEGRQSLQWEGMREGWEEKVKEGEGVREGGGKWG